MMRGPIGAAAEVWFVRAGDWARRAETWRVALAFLLAILTLMFGLAMLASPIGLPMVGLALVVGAALLVRAWLRELLHLMSLGDESFPGRNDKAIWAAILLLAPPVGLYLFRTFRGSAEKPRRPDDWS